jgi:hypothetical protein
MTNLPATQQEVGSRLLQAAQELNSGGGFGKLLKFTKGKYFVGDDEIPAGHEMIAHVVALARGWVKFEDGKVVEQRVGKVADGFILPDRDELGDTDESKWTRDATGEPRDPWSSQMYLPMENTDTGEVVVFVTASHGGRSAIGTLCNVAARNLHKGLPVIRLNTSSYRHRSYGRIETPDFPVVNWTGAHVEARKPSVAKELDDEIPF